ncbi:coiled-coil domain-containing protein 22-like [Senna tora]|uniref:Coiled-coil domain-containing protein 22-like n=1 Tax=Senna tora TaxID=362788 RepID=A0A834TZI2_9FABA|nr:coiled-coil domain-containing protein 22-like [Senna tora]
MHQHETLSPKADASINQDNQTSPISKETKVTIDADPSSSSMAEFSNDELTCASNEKDLSKGLTTSVRDSFGNEGADALKGNGHMPMLKQKTRIESEKLQNHETLMIDDENARTSELEHLERELDLMKAAAEMALNDQHSVDFYLEQLDEQLQAKRNSLLKLESEWAAVRKPLEERKRNLEESLYLDNPDAQEMLQKLRKVEQEEQFILSETEKRDEEYSKLSADLVKQPDVESRKSYIQRINEITKNSRKQDADIERILKETREVQLESNSIQERLHRTYAVADEIVFRYLWIVWALSVATSAAKDSKVFNIEDMVSSCWTSWSLSWGAGCSDCDTKFLVEAKKDPTGREVYKLLTSIHEGFEQISQKILAADRIRREVAEYEMKLAAMACRSLDVDKREAEDQNPLM